MKKFREGKTRFSGLHMEVHGWRYFRFFIH